MAGSSVQKHLSSSPDTMTAYYVSKVPSTLDLGLLTMARIGWAELGH